MIRMDGIRKRFGALEVLRGVDLEIRAGRVTALVGPNGSGKTTLIRMILGLVRPDAGLIRWGEQVLNGDCAYRDRVGYMPQIVRFPENLSGRELLSMLSDLRNRPASDDELIRVLGLEKDLDKPFRTLSGGTRQKVNAAIAFRFAPELLILDEPTAGLDPVSARALKEKVRRERARGRTILITSHIMTELESLADDVVFLLDGRVRFHGSKEAMKELTGESELEGAVARLIETGGGA
jgi:Cu-processing system ATP-binding protein